MKFGILIWSNLKRKKLRTLLTVLSVCVSFVLFGLLCCIQQALTGGVMALGCKYGRSRENFAKGRFLDSYVRAKKLHDRFVQEYGSTICRDVHKKIFGRTFNLWDAKEYKEFESAGAHRDKCPMVAGKVAKWVAEILTETNPSR